MHIRPATTSDVSTLNQLVNSAYRGEGSKRGWTTEADLLDGIRTSETALTEMINNPSARILLVEHIDEIKACVYLEQQENVLYLGMLTVKPENQGKGYGARLVQASENHAVQLGCKKIRITVITARNSLIAYYERKGFVDTGERLPFPSDPAFGIPKQPLEFMVMEKKL
jgi:predicted N-acetyltransferase YhbS